MLTRKMLVMSVLLAAAAVLTGASAWSAVLIVPDNFSTIQAAVDAAQPGDTILVNPGTYNEDVKVWEKNSLTLLGQGATLAGDYGIDIYYSKDIVVQGFLIRGVYKGICTQYTTALMVNSCQFSQCSFGVQAWDCNEIKLQNNKINNCNEGIYLLNVNGVLLNNNYLADNNFGISWYNSCDSFAIGNVVTNTKYNGWEFGRCQNIKIVNNTITDNQSGLGCGWMTNNKFVNNKITNNTLWDIYIGPDCVDNVWLNNKYKTANVTPLP